MGVREPADRRWIPVDVDLSEWTGQIVDLTLATEPGADWQTEPGDVPERDTLFVVQANAFLDVIEGRIVEPGIVVVEGSRIQRVGTVPPGAEVIDLGDVTLLPGLIDPSAGSI